MTRVLFRSLFYSSSSHLFYLVNGLFHVQSHVIKHSWTHRWQGWKEETHPTNLFRTSNLRPGKDVWTDKIPGWTGKGKTCICTWNEWKSSQGKKNWPNWPQPIFHFWNTIFLFPQLRSGSKIVEPNGERNMPPRWQQLRKDMSLTQNRCIERQEDLRHPVAVEVLLLHPLQDWLHLSMPALDGQLFFLTILWQPSLPIIIPTLRILLPITLFIILFILLHIMLRVTTRWSPDSFTIRQWRLHLP